MREKSSCAVYILLGVQFGQAKNDDIDLCSDSCLVYGLWYRFTYWTPKDWTSNDRTLNDPTPKDPTPNDRTPNDRTPNDRTLKDRRLKDVTPKDIKSKNTEHRTTERRIGPNVEYDMNFYTIKFKKLLFLFIVNIVFRTSQLRHIMISLLG